MAMNEALSDPETRRALINLDDDVVANTSEGVSRLRAVGNSQIGGDRARLRG
jgi:hypothetical protein